MSHTDSLWSWADNLHVNFDHISLEVTLNAYVRNLTEYIVNMAYMVKMPVNTMSMQT